MSVATSLFEVYGEPRELWDTHAGFYRSIDDLSQPWQPSPALLNTPLPLRSPLRPVFELSAGNSARQSDNSTSSQTLTIEIPTRKLGLWSRLWRFIKFGNFKAVEMVQYKIPLSDPSSGSYTIAEHDKVKMHEWKAYGYWARPRVMGVDCPNSPVNTETSISSDGLNAIAVTLRDETGAKQPENWVRGIKHRALPPRPTRWKLPRPGEPLPFPWEVQINPLLQHHPWGPSGLSWLVYMNPMESLYHGRAIRDVPVQLTDLAQPATYPFLTHMYFNAVANDCAPQFPWPFTVVNERGIKVGDVLYEIYKTFDRPVSDDEFGSWPAMRQSQSRWAQQRRIKAISDGRDDFDTDVMRRYDSFGAIAFFRGIEPTVDGGGWMITFGNY